MKTPEKRPAFEPATSLFQGPVYDPAMPRPITTTAGAALVFLRSLLSASVLLGWVSGWDGILSGTRLIANTVGALTAASHEMIVAGVSLILVADVVMAGLIFLGRNWPRVVIMLFVMLDVLVAFWAWANSEYHLANGVAFQSLALDILILLALSSHRTAAYARRLERPAAQT
ncbi:MAG: hypothetical protein QM705_15840 [Ancrocorticia sp.]